MSQKTKPQTINGVPVEAIVKPFVWEPSGVQQVGPQRGTIASDLVILDADPKWPEIFQAFKSRILAAFERNPDDGQAAESGDRPPEVTILSINHIGSTSVPGLAAKSNIDIDLVLSCNDLSAEPFYVPRLEAAGWEFRLREPGWHEHRFFRTWTPMSCSLHVWGPRSPEVEKHRILRDYLRTHEADRELYAQTKRECAAAAREKGEQLMQYNQRKEWVIKEILTRAFQELGLLDRDGE